jgi:hypothetical protein
MGWLDNLQDGGQFDGLTNKGFNYNGAWGGPAQYGKSIPKAQDGLYDPETNPELKGVGERVLRAQLENYKKSGNQRGIDKNQALLDKYAAFNASKQKYIDDRRSLVGDYTTRQKTIQSLSEAAKNKYGFDVSQEAYARLSPRQMIAQRMVERANAVTASGTGYPLAVDLGTEGNQLTCIHGVCKAASEAGVDFDALQGLTGVRNDPKVPGSKYTVDYNPTWVQNNNYQKVGYERVPEGEAPQIGDLAQYETQRDNSHSDVEHMEFVKNLTPTGYESFNNYNQTNYPTPGTGNAIRTFEPGSTKIKEFPDTFYFRLKDEVANKIVNTDPQYKPIVESYAKYKDSEEAKQIHDNRDYLDVNKSGYEQAQKFLESLDKPKSKKQDGGLIPIAQDGLIQSSNARMKRGVELSLKERANVLADEHKLRTTGQVPNPRSVKFKQQAPQREEVRKHVPQNKINKGLDIAVNPLTAAGYLARNESIPDNFTHGERNPLDNAIDIINPISVADNIVKLPQDIANGNYSSAAIRALDVLPMAGYLAPAFKDIKKNPLYQKLDNNVIYPLQFRKEIKAMQDYHAGLPAEFETPEARQRLSIALGIDADKLQYPTLTTHPNIGGSHYDSFDNNINIDLRQAKELLNDGLFSPKNIHDHETGHWLQRESYAQSPQFAQRIEKYHRDLDKFNNPDAYPLSEGEKTLKRLGLANPPRKPNMPIATPHPTKVDDYALNMYDYNPSTEEISSKVYDDIVMDDNAPIEEFMRVGRNVKYFPHNGVEPMAHLREMRQNMVDKGFIKNKYDDISEETIKDFMHHNPQDRVSSFTEPTPEKLGGLSELFRFLPAAVPVAGAATVAAQQKRDGGVIEDDRGQWAYPGEVTRINSNNITMEGVPYDVLGISDTGDKKLMKPGKNYKFKGKSVTEYPQGKHGKELDQLTNFTNYNKPQPGGWLDNL